VRLFSEKHSTESLRSFERFTEMLARLGPLVPASQRSTEVRERIRVFEACWRIFEGRNRFAKRRKPFVAAFDEPENPERTT
jgi:hypothetical protein